MASKTVVAFLIGKGLPAEIVSALDTRTANSLAKAQGMTMPSVECEVVTYTTQGKGKTGQYLRLGVEGAAREGFFKLNDGNALDATGKAKLVAIANALGDLVDDDTSAE